jgi:hypothetical protein
MIDIELLLRNMGQYNATFFPSLSPKYRSFEKRGGGSSYFQVLKYNSEEHVYEADRICGLVVRVLGYGSGGPGSIPALPKKK